MLLLTWHGTILRVDQAQNRLTHAPPVPVRAVARDLQVNLPAEITAAIPIGAGMELVPGTRPGTVHLHRNGLYVTIDPAMAFLPCDHPAPIETDALLPLSNAEAAALRHLLATSWQRDGEPVTPALAPGFRLNVHSETIELLKHRPVLQADGTMEVLLETGPLRLSPVPGEPSAPEWHLRANAAGRRCRVAADSGAFQATPDSRLTVSGAPENAFVPMAASRADLDWMYANPQRSPRAGAQSCNLELVHEAGAWVLLNRSFEGTILTPDGVSNAAARLHALPAPLPDGLCREAGEAFLDTAALRGAPVLEGPHAVFYNHGIAGYRNWLLDAVIPLCVMQPHLPAETRLLLPENLAESGTFDRLAVLAAFGFDEMPRVMMPPGLCRVDQLYWPNNTGIGDIPAAALDAARNRALNRLPPPGAERLRIYIQRQGTRRVTNARAIEHRLKQNGFTFHTLENLSIVEQIGLFRRAECVVGVHGGGLANLIFCAPGTRVIELMPESASNRGFAAVASKLDLAHAILPCPPGGDGEGGDLRVDGEKLGAVLRMLLQRL